MGVRTPKAAKAMAAASTARVPAKLKWMMRRQRRAVAGELIGGVAEEGAARHPRMFSLYAGSSSNGGTPDFAHEARMSTVED